MSDDLVTRLARLARPAPTSVLPGVLVRTGLAEPYIRRPSVLGDVLVAFNDHGVSAVGLAEGLEAFEASVVDRLGRPPVAVEQVPAGLERRLERAIAEGRPGSLPLDLRGLTAFQAGVLMKAAEIPRGEVRPYGWVAGELGSPGAVRAVGTALARNPVPLIVPCHRVVRSDGSLGDYSLGEATNKPRLLRDEGVDIDALRGLARRGVRYVGSDTTHVFCHPSCRHARRIGVRHRVEFRTGRQAVTAGYRPCRHCRPRAA